MAHAIASGRLPSFVSVTEPKRGLAPDERAKEALARGDRRAALVVLMEAYGDAIHRYCHKVLRKNPLADDVHQLVFIQAFEDLGSFSGSSSFRPWLYAIANHRCLDALKASRRWFSRFVLGDEPPEEMDPAPTGEDRALARGTAEALEQCLGKLKPHVRIAVVLRYQEGFSYEEMAEICREKPATLQARVARAMPLLRQCLENKGIDLR
jgi:RNA polymerase sigma-70 factor (ECF subfamily)